MSERGYKIEENLEHRATPRTPQRRFTINCPVCGNDLIWDDPDIRENFCSRCGQAIDWEKVDENMPQLKELQLERW